MPWRRTRIGIGIASLLSSPFWHLVGHLSTIQTLVAIGKFVGPTMLAFLAAWGWAISAPLGFVLLWLTLKRKPESIRPTPELAPSMPSDLRIRDGRSRIKHLEIINARGPSADLSSANVDIDHFTIRHDPPSAPNQLGEGASMRAEDTWAAAPWNETLRILSTEQLRARAKGEAQRLRALEEDYHPQYMAVWSAVESVKLGMTPDETQAQIRRQELAREQLDDRRVETYRSGFHRDAVAVRNELWRRLGIGASDPHAETCLDNGELSGDHPFLRAADEIDTLAAQLI